MSVYDQLGIPTDVAENIRKNKDYAEFAKWFEPIKHRRIIGVNTSFLLGSFIDVCFFGDYQFYTTFIRELNNFTNLKLTIREEVDNEQIKFIKQTKASGIATNGIAWNTNSGLASISLAYQLGCKRVVLLGFDMNKTTTSHWHNEYKERNHGQHAKKENYTFDKPLTHVDQISRDAKALGIEIINANPSSAIEAFTKRNLKEIWAE